MANTTNLNLNKIPAGTKPYYQAYWDNLDLLDISYQDAIKALEA